MSLSAILLCIFSLFDFITPAHVLSSILFIMLPMAGLILGSCSLILPVILSSALNGYKDVLGTAGSIFGLTYYLLIAVFTWIMGATVVDNNKKYKGIGIIVPLCNGVDLLDPIMCSAYLNFIYVSESATISMGYRINSVRATQFRQQWATQVLREFALKGYVLVYNNDLKNKEINSGNIHVMFRQLNFNSKS